MARDTDCAIAITPATKPRMPKPKIYEGNLFIRTAPGMKDQVERLRGDEPQGKFLRRVLAAALADMEAGRWKPALPTEDEK